MYDPDKSKAYKKLVIAEATSAKNRNRWPVMDGALSITLTIRLVRPKSAPKSRTRPEVRPDIDNYTKAILDGLNGIVYRDDGQIVDLIAKKVYCAPGEPAGVSVTLWEVEEG